MDDSDNMFTTMRPQLQRIALRTTIADGSDALASSFATSYTGVVAFMTVVAEGSFARAGDRLGIGRSAVSRSVQKLETQLGMRLISRTTRSLSLTNEGQLFHGHCKPGVECISQALEGMRDRREGPPRGTLRIWSAVGFGRKVVAPLLKGFCNAYPGVEVDLILDDAPTDFAAGNVDISFRNGRMEDSQVIAKLLVPMQMLVCASPEYALRYGVPGSIDDLADHRCVNLRVSSGRIREWEFKVDGQRRKATPRSVLTFNDPDLVLAAVLDGQGIAQLAGYQIRDLLREGRLVACLAQYAPDDSGHYLCYLNRQHLPSRIRVFIDHMTGAIRALDLHCAIDQLLVAA
jgi:DNA-binding transcriptional LysR family regulator